MERIKTIALWIMGIIMFVVILTYDSRRIDYVEKLEQRIRILELDNRKFVKTDFIIDGLFCRVRAEIEELNKEIESIKAKKWHR